MTDLLVNERQLIFLYIVMHETCLMGIDCAKYQSYSRMKLSKADHVGLDGIPHYERSDG